MINLSLMTKEVKSQKNNTFSPDDGMKIVLISPSQELSIKEAKLLLGLPQDTTSSSHTYTGTHYHSKVIIYAYSPGSYLRQLQSTVAVDALLLYLSNDDDLDAIKNEVDTYFSFVSVRLLVGTASDKIQKALNCQVFVPGESFTNVIKEIINFGEVSEKAEDPLHIQILNKLFELDRKEYTKIVDAFTKYDVNISGTLDQKELPKLVADLGEDPETSHIREAMLALDKNHDQLIDLQEFIHWWKIGRQNILALSKIYQLSNKMDEIISNIIDINGYEIDKKSEVVDKLNKVKVSIVTPMMTEDTAIETRIYLRMAAGGEGRKDATKNFLSRYTNIVHNYADENWINISFFVQSLTKKGDEIKHYLETFRENLISYTEKNFMPGLSEFIRDFVIFKFVPQEYSATIIFQFKKDVFEILKYALSQLISIKDWLSDSNGSAFDLDIKINTPNELGMFITESRTLFEFLETADIQINGYGLKDRIKILLRNLNDKHKEYLKILRLLFVPNNFQVDQVCNIEESILGTGNLLDFNLKHCYQILNFVRKNIDPELLNCLTRLELGCNLFDIFLGVELFSEKIWGEQLI